MTANTSVLQIEQKGHVFLFSSQEDYDLCTMPVGTVKKPRRKIYIKRSPWSKTYACVSISGKRIMIHHILMGKPINGLMIDHLNGNPFDNRRDNLKIVTRHENCLNKPTKTKYKRWVQGQKNGTFKSQVKIPLGSYKTEQEAHDVALKFIKSYIPGLYINPEYLK